MLLTLEEMNLSPGESSLPSYVAVEGPIGVGKSTLAKSLAHSFKYETLLELPEENPFLDRFYRDKSTYALQTQLAFLFQRIRQIEEIRQADLFETTRVADFILEKDPLFAEVTLDEHELDLYQKIYSHVVSSAPTPDLVVYLQAPVAVLAERIKNRGNDIEQLISLQYLESLNTAYMNFFHQYDSSPLLIVNAAEIDFATNPAHYQDLVSRILNTTNGRHFYNPVTREI